MPAKKVSSCLAPAVAPPQPGRGVRPRARPAGRGHPFCCRPAACGPICLPGPRIELRHFEERQMSLTPGTTIGSYTVVGFLGAGGMGEVYKPRDSKLDRDVAIKVLPESFAGDADRVARFTREAKTLASLNHPNIAQVFGIEGD